MVDNHVGWQIAKTLLYGAPSEIPLTALLDLLGLTVVLPILFVVVSCHVRILVWLVGIVNRGVGGKPAADDVIGDILDGIEHSVPLEDVAARRPCWDVRAAS